MKFRSSVAWFLSVAMVFTSVSPILAFQGGLLGKLKGRRCCSATTCCQAPTCCPEPEPCNPDPAPEPCCSTPAPVCCSGPTAIEVAPVATESLPCCPVQNLPCCPSSVAVESQPIVC